MGGGITTPPATDTGEEDSSLDKYTSQLSSPLLRSELSMRADDAAVDKQSQSGSVCGEYGRLRDFEANERTRQNVYRKIMQSGELSLIRSKGLEQAKSRVLRYTPGAWTEMAGAMKRRNYDVPKTTTLLLVGPKGSGKSSLVNRISKALEDDKFASERAQVSYNSSVGDGTLFLQEYMIPRGSTSFCIYDTRSLSDDSAENIKMLNHWMENGVRNGELAIRDSDSQSLRTAMMCKARDSGYLSSEFRKVNFVIFAVNGLSVLKSLESEENAETQYTQLIASAFNCPYLAFKDDKPAVVVTHGDLLSHDERARAHVHLGELLGIPPTTQIFDIPESSDPVTESTIIDMLRYSLEHAEKNLPHKKKVHTISPLPCMLLLMLLGTATNLWCLYRHACIQHCQSPQAHIQHCPSPQEHIQKEHFPQGHIQKEHFPQGHIQKEPLPQEHIQQDPLPQEENHQDPLPREEIHQDPLPQEHIQQDSLPREEIHQDPLPQEHIQKEHFPQGHIQKEPLPQEHIQQDPLPREENHQDPLPREEIHQDPLPQEHIQKEHFPQGHIQKEPLPQEHIQQDPLPREEIHQDPLPQEHIQKEHIPQGQIQKEPLPQEHIQQDPLPQEEIHQDPLPREEIHQDPLPQEQIQHCTSPEAHVQHDCGPLPKIHTQHGPSPRLASSTPSPLAAPLPPSVPFAHIDGSLPQENIQDGSLPPSPQAHVHDDPSPPNAPSAQTHLYHGLLPRVQAALEKIRTEVEKFRTKFDWS